MIRRFAQTVADSQKFNSPAPLQALSMALGSGSFRAQPLLVGWWLPGTPFAVGLPQSPEITTFMQDAERVSLAFLFAIEWLRSWLPGYPVGFRLPHLDPHASRVARRGFPNSLLPWALEIRRMGFATKVEIHEELGALIELEQAELRLMLFELRRCLWESDEWAAFGDAKSALTPTDDAILKALVTRFRDDARRADENGGGRLMSFDAALRAALLRCEQAAADEPRVGAYYRAFRRIDRTVEGIGSLISRYAVGRPIETLTPARAIWLNDESGEVRLTVANLPYFPELNDVIHIASDLPALQRLARVEGMHVEMNHRSGEQMDLIVTSIESGEEATPQVDPAPDPGDFIRILYA
jgi:hypothetical protein